MKVASIVVVLTLSASIAYEQNPERRDFSSEGLAIKAVINGPRGLAVYGSNLYIAEGFRNVIRRVDLTTGSISSVKVKSKLDNLGSIAVDPSGDLIVAEFTANRIRKIHIADGTVSPLSIGFRQPDFVTTDHLGNIYVADLCRILRLDAQTGSLTMVATGGLKDGGGGGSATVGGQGCINGVAVDQDGNLFVSQYGNVNDTHRICRLDVRTGTIQTIAGTGQAGFGGDGGPALSARLQSPSDLLLDRNGNLFVLDPVNDRVRRIDAASRVITTVAGSAKGFGGDGGPAKAAKLNNPSALAIDAQGNLYIAEFVNNRVRRVDAKTGIITTVAGNGLPHRIDVLE